jgi:hypothetical protein
VSGRNVPPELLFSHFFPCHLYLCKGKHVTVLLGRTLCSGGHRPGPREASTRDPGWTSSLGNLGFFFFFCFAGLVFELRASRLLGRHSHCLNHSTSPKDIFFFFLVVLEFEFRAFTLSHSTSPFFQWMFSRWGAVLELFAQAGFEP